MTELLGSIKRSRACTTFREVLENDDALSAEVVIVPPFMMSCRQLW